MDFSPVSPGQQSTYTRVRNTGARSELIDFAERNSATICCEQLIAAQFVIPYRKRGKNDANDAEAICEAVGRPNMRFVAINRISTY
jgi:transposase